MRLFGREWGGKKPASPARYAPIQRRFFSSGELSRLTGDWPTQPVPAEWIIYRYQRILVARSREQAHNNDYMRAYLRLQRQNIVGATGIILQSQASTARGKADSDARAAIEDAFSDWGRREHCDVAGKLSWRAMQSACVETAARDGEYFLRIVSGRHGGKYGFALQVLDPQRCPVDFDRNDLPNGAFIRHGVEFNAYGRALAFHFSESSAEHSTLAYSYAGKSYTRIPAEEIIHGFIVELPGQKRGLPWLATSLFRAKQMSAMEDAAVVNARVGAAKMGFIEFEAGSGLDYSEEELEALTIDAEAGAFPILPDGAKLNKFDPIYPSGELSPFMKLMLRGMAAGGGVAYENLSQDREGVNYTSIRHGTLDERETYKERQEWLIEELCERVFEAWFARALLAGLIVTGSARVLEASQIARYATHKWQPRRWDWVDPKADMAAAESSKNNLLASPSQLIRERGKDPDQVWTEFAEDIAAMRAKGIPDEFIQTSLGQQPIPDRAANE